MNLILLFSDEIGDGGYAELTDHRAGHIIAVLNSQVGDLIRAGIVNGPVGTARIKSIDSGKERVVLQFSPQGGMPNRPPVDIILAMPRPIMLKRILTQAAALGVGKLFLINAARVEKSFFQASLLRQEKMLPIFLHGLEQARDTLVPEVEINKRFKIFVEDRIPALGDAYSLKLVAHPEEPPLPAQVRFPLTGRSLLAIGPEGGWSDYEIDQLRHHGFISYGFGERILKVDTAVVALLSQLAALREVNGQ